MARIDAIYSASSDEPAPGVYDSLVTVRLAARMDQWRADGLLVADATVDRADKEAVSHLLGRYVGDAAAKALHRSKDPVALTNRLLRLLDRVDDIDRDDGSGDGTGNDGGNDGGEQDLDDVTEALDPVARFGTGDPKRLLSVVRAVAGAVDPEHPSTRLSEAALLTNAKGDPNLGHELRRELSTATGVDLLCAFVKWSGLRILAKQLEAMKDRGIPLRVLTTTYMGATERDALDRLVRDYGAEVRISYEQRSTRLHAKAWLLRRSTGFDTAYVGSSNLSRAALLDGLEWNVRLSAVATPRLLEKFEATFESYWDGDDFEPYDPDRDGTKLDAALAQAGAGTRGRSIYELPALAPHPYPHQRVILEDLDTQRRMLDIHKNLVVAATGTGKTVVAAFDYRNLRDLLGKQPSLLFLAHRKEILEQAMKTYRQVVTDPVFGELHVGSDRAKGWRHVFASVQLLHRGLDRIDPEQFDVIVIDEFHHADAPTYRQIINHFRPKELLGLTATPERADGVRVQDEYFDGRVASEIRLWDALEADLLSPFHYFGINDDVDLRGIAWTRNGYDTQGLENVFTGNDARARLVFNALRDKTSDLDAIRGLGFCVSVKHAQFMADFFNRVGVRSRYVSGGTDEAERRAALDALRAGEVNFLFAVDLFNEGLDIPDVNTLLLLRPTGSPTVFLQQLGRGLRRTEDKAVLTVLDFVGQHRKEYRLEDRFHALTGLRGARLQRAVDDDFPLLPSGCQIDLDRISKDRVVGAIQDHLDVNVRRLTQELQSTLERRLADFLHTHSRSVTDVYRGGRSWTTLQRRAGLLDGEGSPLEADLVRRMRSLIHVDDETRALAYERLVGDDCPPYGQLDFVEQAFARMLFFSLWRDGGGFESYDAGLAALRGEAAVCDEIRQIVEYGANRPRYVSKMLDGGLARLPLAVNAAYSQDEILAALGYVTIDGRKPSTFREGVAWVPEVGCDALFVTLHKSEDEFSPQTMYRDYALSANRFHWESQNRTSAGSSAGRRYQRHRDEGSCVLLFTRERKEIEGGIIEPYVFHGRVEYESHVGERPMAVTWRLTEPMPTELHRRAAITV